MHRHRGLEYHRLKKIYTYSSLFLLAYYGVPWSGLAVWRIAMVNGCESYAVRPYLEATCLQPYSYPGNATPWYLDLWETQASNPIHLDNLPPLIEAIMVSHLTMYDAEMALVHQDMKLKDIPSNVMAADELLSILRKSHILPSLNLTKLTRRSGTDQVRAIASDLAPQLDDFSRMFCVQKDIMNHALRTFAEAYAVTITTSDYQDVTISSVLVCPGVHFLRFINHYTLIPWLPEPKLYSLQIKAEIRYQKRRFIDEVTAALDRINASSPTARYFHNPSSRTQLLEAAMKTVAMHQQMIMQKIDKSAPIPWRWIYKPDHILTLQEHHALSERIRRRILVVQETIEVYEAYYRRLRNQLQQLRQGLFDIPPFEFSPTGEVAVPEPLLAHVQRSHLFSRQKSSSADYQSDGSGINNVSPHPYVFFYNLDWIDETRISTLRSELAPLCQDRTNAKIVSGNLYTVCLIYNLAATMSELDDDTLTSVQRSWVVERREAIRRYERQTETDRESIVNLIFNTDQAYPDGRLIPDYL